MHNFFPGYYWYIGYTINCIQHLVKCKLLPLLSGPPYDRRMEINITFNIIDFLFLSAQPVNCLSLNTLLARSSIDQLLIRMY